MTTATDHGNHCAPDKPAPNADEHMCEGKILMPCCCRLYTRTLILEVNPQTEPSLVNYLRATVQAFEGAGYVIQGHFVEDAGAGWVVGLTYGWYQ